MFPFLFYKNYCQSISTRCALRLCFCICVSLMSLFIHSIGVQLLALLVPTLVSYLLDENAISSAPQVSKSLHDFALQNLMRIGPLYPAAFKIVIGAAPELKTRLESAIRANQASSKAKAAARQAQPTVQAAPTIKLKTSFFWKQQKCTVHSQNLVLCCLFCLFIFCQQCTYMPYLYQLQVIKCIYLCYISSLFFNR